MIVITKRQLINAVAESWKNNYYDTRYTRSGEWYSPEKEKIYYALLSASTEKEIADIISNTSWTRNECNECEKDCLVTVVLGGRYGDPGERLCPDCLQKAVDLCKAEIKEGGE